MKITKLLPVLFCTVLCLLGSCAEDKSDPAARPSLAVTPTELAPASCGATVYATATSNQEIRLESKKSWCRAVLLADKKSENIKMVVEPNPDSDSREAIVVVSAGGCEPVVITLTQAAKGTDKRNTCDLLTFQIDAGRNGLSKTVFFTKAPAENLISGLYLEWIDGAEPEMLIPTFTTNGEKVLLNDTPLVSEQTKISFAEDMELVVVAENGDRKSYTISLNCPQINTELPVIRMQPDYQITSKDDYVKTKLDIYSPSTSAGRWSATDEKVDVRGRGNSTWILPKKPYRIKFPSKFSPIGLDHATEKSWVILSHDMDKSLIRNHIAFEMSRILFNAADGYHDSSAVLFTPCSQYVNLYMNSDYQGLYQMSDQMERAQGRIAVDKLSAADGADPEKITGGYIIETDIHEGTHYSSHGIRMSYKYPKDDDFDPAQYAYIEKFIDDAESALYGADFKNPESGWRKFFDEKTLADFIIVKELAGDMDGYTSTYMYKRRGVDKLFFGPVWDCDKGWDNDKRVPQGAYDPLTNLMIHAGFQMPGANGPDWFNRLWQDETFRAFVAARWTQKKAQLTTMMSRVFDEKPAEMAKAIAANFSVWEFYYQASTEAKMPAATYEKEIERLRTLTQLRVTLLDRLFK